ncbi:HD domain-containing phosphohydrolase [Clostridium sp.]|uniref:HD-GYP domain-containing protein n=1 Tax=Clostridium sp. TaxID=1506 RepID=UPI001A4351E8|nr:HD domain-containing phosphohydrolase [Clostridium sp.]MBK5242632.1 HD domain-containing protein [Clostridium sp.]
MSSTIFILTNNKAKISIVRDFLSSDYEVYSVTKTNLMVELYKKEPKVLIVDIDSYEEQTIKMIKSIIAIEYLPVIYVYSEKVEITDLLKDEIVIEASRIQETIVYLLKQSIIFKSKYDKVMESYNAIDLINGEIKSYIKKYVSVEDTHTITKEMLDLIFAKNLFLKNKPETIWVLISKKDIYNYSLFQLNNDEYEEKLCADIAEEACFNFDIYASTGFNKNFNVDGEFSDISFSRKIFPKVIRQNTPEIKNFAGFSIGNIILVGMNYKNIVTNYEVGIIKALSINFDLMDTMRHQINELEKSFEYTANALARAAEANDDLTGKHIKRVNIFSKRIAEELGMSKEFTRKIYNAAQMHDVGKIIIDKSILTKPGKLTDEEFEMMKNHTVYGESIIGDSEYLKMSAEIARSHHEKYDGTGYPDSKKGEEIPLSARIVFLADIYDALRSARTYKPAFSHEKAYEIISMGDGRVNPEHFDPNVLEVFKRMHLDFKKIYEEIRH